jgi:hypothetical protein
LSTGCAQKRKAQHRRIHEEPILVDESRLLERVHQRDAAGGHDVSARRPLSAGTASTRSPRTTLVPSHPASSSVEKMTNFDAVQAVADTGLVVGLLRPVAAERFERQPADEQRVARHAESFLSRSNLGHIVGRFGTGGHEPVAGGVDAESTLTFSVTMRSRDASRPVTGAYPTPR